MERDEIDGVIRTIMYYDGPDRHVDGHDKITDFIMALLEGDGYQWVSKYFNDRNIDG